MYKELFNNNIVSAAVIDTSGKILEVNIAFTKMFGSDSKTKKFSDFLARKDELSYYQDKVRDFISESNPNDNSGQFEVHAVNFEGMNFMAKVNIFLFNYQEVKKLGIFILDITEEHQKEIDLLQHNEELNTITEQLKATNNDLLEKERLVKEQQIDLQTSKDNLEIANERLKKQAKNLEEEVKKERSFRQSEQLFKIFKILFLVIVGYLALENTFLIVVDIFGDVSQELVNSSNNRSNLLIQLLVAIIGGLAGRELGKEKNKKPKANET